MLDVVKKLESRLSEIDGQLVLPENLSDRKKLIELNRERRHIDNTLKCGLEYRRVKIGIAEAKDIIKANEDSELVEMAREELSEYELEFPAIENEFKLKLLPRDPTDEKAAVVEIRAGTGGDEAALFAGEIFRMYQRYADHNGWKIEILNTSESQVGGFKEIIFDLSGEKVYGRMKYESGVHRVQRVPSTETQGRVHTSAVTVAVFPEAEEVDLEIKDNEIKVDVFRSSGPGGQSVNTTDSAVRLTYLPTGLVVICQDEKSQLKNKVKAMKVLRARLYDEIMAKQQAKMAEERRLMVATGDRSAKIRTYNFPQSRVTDHRINLTLYRLNEVMAGDVDCLIEPLSRHDEEVKLKLHAS